MDKQNIIQKIKKCFGLAEGAKKIGSQAEAETALAMAHKLMAEHNIEMTSIQFDEQKGTLKEDIVTERMDGVKLTSDWRRNLAMVAAGLCNTGVYTSRDIYNNMILCFVGLKSDCLISMEMYRDLVNVVAYMRGKYKGSHAEKKSFALGIVRVLQERSREMKRSKDNSKKSSTTALMVVKDQAIERHMESLGLRVTHSRERTRADAYHQGRAAGHSVPLTPGRHKIGHS